MTELQSVVCSEWLTDNDVQEIYHRSVYNLTHENVNTTTGRNGPTLSGPARPGTMTSRPVPGPARKICKFQAQARPVRAGPGRAYGPPGPYRALIDTFLVTIYSNSRPNREIKSTFKLTFKREWQFGRKLSQKFVLM